MRAGRARDTSAVTSRFRARDPGNDVDASARLSAGVDGATVPSRLVVGGRGESPTLVGTSTTKSRMTNSVPPINAKQGVHLHAKISLMGFAACIGRTASVPTLTPIWRVQKRLRSAAPKRQN
jgi:hypothetical protein